MEYGEVRLRLTASVRFCWSHRVHAVAPYVAALARRAVAPYVAAVARPHIAVGLMQARVGNTLPIWRAPSVVLLLVPMFGSNRALPP